MPCQPCVASKYGLIPSVLSTQRPSGTDLYAGKRYYETDTGREMLYDGTGHVIMSEPAQSWTPVVTNFTIGTGGAAAATGYYKREDGWIDISGTLVLGTGGGFAVSGSLTLTLPIAALGLRANQLSITANDSGSNEYLATNGNGTTSCVLFPFLASGTYLGISIFSSTVPFAWGSGDYLDISGRYRMTTRYS